VCAIGTTEPWSAAGLSLDVRALAELGAHPVIVVAAVSAQDASGVHALYALPLEVVRAQFDALGGAAIAAFRIGALPTQAIADEVARRLAASAAPGVYDPVLSASAGGALVADDALALAWSVIRRARVVTPNLREAELLLGRPVRDALQMRAAAAEFVARGARAALVKGGHLAGEALDVLCDGSLTRDFSAPRFDRELRGTGCLLADALALGLARGADLAQAVESARAYVREKIERGVLLGGMRIA